eukprot:439408-Prorocentrum_minimum.AAC.1
MVAMFVVPVTVTKGSTSTGGDASVYVSKPEPNSIPTVACTLEKSGISSPINHSPHQGGHGEEREALID